MCVSLLPERWLSPEPVSVLGMEEQFIPSKVLLYVELKSTPLLFYTSGLSALWSEAPGQPCRGEGQDTHPKRSLLPAKVPQLLSSLSLDLAPRPSPPCLASIS